MAKQREPKKKRLKKEWFLLQSRLEVEHGRELKQVAEADGMPVSVYVRRLVLRHLAGLRADATEPRGGAEEAA